MPYAVTHVLVAIVIAELLRDYWKKFNLHYVLIAGIGGMLPDLDVLAYWFLSYFGYTIDMVHRTFSHTIWVVLILILVGYLCRNVFIKKYKLKLGYVFYFLALGSFIHLMLDGLLMGSVFLFYPFNFFEMSFNLAKVFPWPDSFLAALDAILLVGWLVHEDLKHNIRDFL